MKTIMVIGAGQMGSGIAQVFAQSGFDVYLNDMNEAALNKGMNNIEKLLTRAVEKGRMIDDQMAETLSRLKASTSLEDASNCDVVIEAVVENMDVKTSVFKQLDDLTPAHTILASNTSSLPITEIASVTKNQRR